MIESWVNIPGYEGLYQASSNGQVRSLELTLIKRNGVKETRKGRVLKQVKVSGYYRVVLCKNGCQKNFLVHRLVAMTFLKNPKNKPQVNHIDGNKKNNNIDNLEWSTNKENIQHALREGLMDKIKGCSHYKSRLSKEDVLQIRKLKGKKTQKEISTMFNISRRGVGYILNNKTYKEKEYQL